MKVFISWSGESSKEVANFLKVWIKSVIQATDPWVSTHDIASGSVWLENVNEHLNDACFGILCVTQENKNKPWLLFEAGALAKGLSKNKVCPLLIDLEPSDIAYPLAMFQATTVTQESMYQLITTLNNEFASNQKLEAAMLKESFDLRWPRFEEFISTVLSKKHPQESVKRTPQDSQRILDEILMNTRLLNEVVSQFDKKLSKMDGLISNSTDTDAIVDDNKAKAKKLVSDFVRELYKNGLVQPRNPKGGSAVGEIIFPESH